MVWSDIMHSKLQGLYITLPCRGGNYGKEPDIPAAFERDDRLHHQRLGYSKHVKDLLAMAMMAAGNKHTE